jgi:hypothetical protein
MDTPAETSKMMQLLKVLLEERKSQIKDLEQKLSIHNAELIPLVYILEYLGIVEVKGDMVSMSAQSYSLLFEPLLTHEGTEQFVLGIQNGTERFNEENIKIPALMIPILLLRSFTPYFGLILRDIEKKENLGLGVEQKEFLYNFFSLFKFDYGQSMKKWKNLSFTGEEFHHIWLLVNQALPTIIRTSSKYELVPLNKDEKRSLQREKPKEIIKQPIKIQKPDDQKTTSKANPVMDERFYNIPVENLKAFFGENEKKTPKIRYNSSTYAMDNLIKIVDLKLTLSKLVSQLADYAHGTGQITLNVYQNVLKWDYSDEKGDVPSLFLAPEGIYGDKTELKNYTKQRISHQARYLKDLLGRLG